MAWNREAGCGENTSRRAASVVPFLRLLACPFLLFRRSAVGRLKRADVVGLGLWF